MPAKTAKSVLGAALKNHAKDETNYGQQYIDLPAGIDDGRARLVDAKLGQYKQGDNQGESFIYLAGVVVSPVTATKVVRQFVGNEVKILEGPKEVKIEGQRTSMILPLCATGQGDSARDVDENVDRALNELRKLGGKNFTADVETEEDLVACLEALKEAAPVFKFSTSAGEPTRKYPKERVWENWYGTDEDWIEEDRSGAGVDDQTEVVEEEVPEAEESVSNEDDWLALAEKADEPNPDRESQQRLESRAEELEIEGYAEMPTWKDVAEAIVAVSQPAEAEESVPEESWVSLQDKGSLVDSGEDPEDAYYTELSDLCEEHGLDPNEYETWEAVGQALAEVTNGPEDPTDWEEGQVGYYKPPKKRNAVEVEITKIFSNGKANLKNIDSKEVYRSVELTQLTDVELTQLTDTA